MTLDRYRLLLAEKLGEIRSPGEQDGAQIPDQDPPHLSPPLN
jgi:hypothetical protein